MRYLSACRQRAQALTEFALVVPVLLVFTFAILEGSLLLFIVETAHFAAADGARQASELGNAPNADSATVQTIRNTYLGRTGLSTVSEIDIFRLIEQPDGSLTVDNSHYNRYRLDGTPLSVSWPPTSRDVVNGESDFLGISIQFTYNWQTGFFSGAGSPLALSQTFYVRLEPQTY